MLFEVALFGKLFQQAFQVDASGTLDAKGFADIAFVGPGRVLRDPGENFVFGWDACHEGGLACGRARVTGDLSWWGRCPQTPEVFMKG